MCWVAGSRAQFQVRNPYEHSKSHHVEFRAVMLSIHLSVYSFIHCLFYYKNTRKCVVWVFFRSYYCSLNTYTRCPSPSICRNFEFTPSGIVWETEYFCSFIYAVYMSEWVLVNTHGPYTVESMALVRSPWLNDISGFADLMLDRQPNTDKSTRNRKIEHCRGLLWAFPDAGGNTK